MARRGENIRKRKDGRWEGRYIKGRKPDRTAIWGYVYGHSYTEVKKKMTMRKAEVRACALSEQNPTFQEHADFARLTRAFISIESGRTSQYKEIYKKLEIIDRIAIEYCDDSIECVEYDFRSIARYVLRILCPSFH